MYFAEKIKMLREELKLTQSDVGQKIGTNNRHISMLENSKYQPSLETVKKLSQLFNVTCDYLIFENVPRSSTFHVQHPDVFELLEQLVRYGDQDALGSIKHLAKAAVFKAKVDQVTRE